MSSVESRLLRVGIVTETYPPEVNGVAGTLWQLVEGLRQRGHELHVIRPRQKGERAREKKQGHPEPFLGSDSLREETGEPVGHNLEGRSDETLVPGLPIPGYPSLRFGLPVYLRLRRMWRDTPPDIIYIATQGPLGHAALEAARAAGIPVLTGFHTRFHTYSGHYGVGILRPLIVAALRRFHNRSMGTLVPSEELRDELMDLGFRNVHACHRGVDTERFDPERRSEELRRRWGCRSGDRVMLHVGRLAAEKNLDLIFQVFADIASEFSDTKLVLVGDGPELERLRTQYPNVLLTGVKVGVELAEHYASGDLFLFPSLTETFGNVVPEAMASGLTVIAFGYGAAGSWVHNWENGVTVPVGDADAFRAAVGEVLRDDARLRDMGKAARITAEGMSWGRVVEELEERLIGVIDDWASKGHP